MSSLRQSDFQSALKIHNAVAASMHRPSPPYPHTEQALQLAMEVTHTHRALVAECLITRTETKQPCSASIKAETALYSVYPYQHASLHKTTADSSQALAVPKTPAYFSSQHLFQCVFHFTFLNTNGH